MNETKNSILMLAVTQLQEGGYPKLNFKDIADELGVTRANIHHHFSNKESLAQEAIKAHAAVQLEILNEMYEQDLPLTDALAGMETHIWQDLEETDGCGVCACSHLLSDPNNTPNSIMEYALEYFFSSNTMIEKFLERAHEKGELIEDADWKKVALELNMMFYGFIYLSRVIYDKPDVRKPFEGMIVNWIKNYIR